MKSKKNLVTGITVSGDLTLAHHLIIFKNLKKLAEKYNIFLFIADLHAITSSHEVKHLNKKREETAIEYVASQIPASIFIQSEVNGHTELAFVLGCHTKIGELNRMTQFKEKQKAKETSFGLMNYPVLMAADILLYQGDTIVGPDQHQHLELTKQIARRINNKFGKIFRIPAMVDFTNNQYRIRDLLDPEKKMSKSAKNENGVVFLKDTPAIIERKISRAVTDSENKIAFDFANKPGISNLILIYSLCEDLTIEAAEEKLIKKCANYFVLKKEVSEAINNSLKEFFLQRKKLVKDPEQVRKILDQGRNAAQKIAHQQLKKLSLLGFQFS